MCKRYPAPWSPASMDARAGELTWVPPVQHSLRYLCPAPTGSYSKWLVATGAFTVHPAFHTHRSATTQSDVHDESSLSKSRLSGLQCRKFALPRYPLKGFEHAFDPIAVFTAFSRKDAHDFIRLGASRGRHLAGPSDRPALNFCAAIRGSFLFRPR
jgi:hypothetical protein